MTRRPAASLVAMIALAALTCLGCESLPDASAESGSTCAHMSERNDAQCAADLEDCSRECLHGKDHTEVAAHGAEGCQESDCTCPHGDEASCAEAHAAGPGEGGHGCAQSDCTCPQKGQEGCSRAGAEPHPGCPRARDVGAAQDAGS